MSDETKKTETEAVQPEGQQSPPADQAKQLIMQEAKIRELENIISDQETRIIDLETEKEDMQHEIDELQSVVKASGAVAPSKAPDAVEVTIKKKKYQFKLQRFNVGGKDLLASEVAKDNALSEKLLADHPGLFVAL